MTAKPVEKVYLIDYEHDGDLMTDVWTEQNQDFIIEHGWAEFWGEDCWTDLPQHILDIVCEEGII